jgi:hypothetical protein
MPYLAILMYLPEQLWLQLASKYFIINTVRIDDVNNSSLNNTYSIRVVCVAYNAGKLVVEIVYNN